MEVDLFATAPRRSRWQRLVAAVLLAAVPATSTLPLAAHGAPGGGGGNPGPGWPPTMPVVPSVPADAILPTSGPIELAATTGVTAAGSGVASIPLRVPAGPAGMAPALTISVSGGGNGRLGVGASLSSGGAITPCGQTVAVDGFTDGVDFDGSDAYCLDGARLVPVGFDVDGGRVYHTEQESLAKVVSYRAPGEHQPSFWKVWLANGQIATYRPRTAMRLEGHGEAMAPTATVSVKPIYPIAELADRSGHLIRYVYEDDDGAVAGDLSYRLARIDYSFVNNETARRSVRLHYQPRTDIAVTYQSGVRARMTTRLASIEMRAPNPTTTATAWTYNLAYEPSPDTERSRLRSVEMCAADGVCSWKKGFVWTSPNATIADHVVSADVEFTPEALAQDIPSFAELLSNNLPTTPHPNGANVQNFYRDSEVGLLIFDSDGDGRDDILYRTRDTRFDPYYAAHHESLSEVYGEDDIIALNYQRGQLKLRTTLGAGALLAEADDVTDTLEPAALVLQHDFWHFHLNKSRVADVDFDGRLDLIAARRLVWDRGWWRFPAEEQLDLDVYNAHEWFYGYTTFHGGAWASSPNTIEEVALAHAPVFRVGPSSVGVHLVTPPFQRVVADLDGDGRADKLDVLRDVWASEVLTEDWLTPGGTAPHHNYIATLATGATRLFDMDWTCGNGSARVSDVDGDGRADVLAADATVTGQNSISNYPGTYQRLALADNTQGFHDDSTNLWSGDCTTRHPDFVLADFNGDGLDDAFYPPHALELGNSDDDVAWIRWNLGGTGSHPDGTGKNGFSELQPMSVANDPGGTFTANLFQHQPMGKWEHVPVAWDRGTRVVDVNRDGRDDLVTFRVKASGCSDPDTYAVCSVRNTVVTAYLSMGDHLVAKPLGTWPDSGVSLAAGFTTAQVGDVTGDGAVELVHVAGGRIHAVELPWRTQGDLLAAVLEEGAVSHPVALFDYSAAWWGAGAVAPATTDCGYPMACPRRGAPVVSRHRTYAGNQPDGTAMWREQDHVFLDPRVDLRGRGSLGFGVHRTWDRDLGAETVDTFDHVTRVGEFYPGVGQVISSVRLTPIMALPSDAELASGSRTPGLDPSSQITLRVDETVTHYIDRQCDTDASIFTGWPGCTAVPSHPAILMRRADTVDQRTYETTAQLVDPSTMPHYLWTVDEPLVTTHAEMDYDAYGNPTLATITTADTASQTRVRYANETANGQWLLGLATHSAVASAVDGVNLPWGWGRPRRIVDTTYEPTTGLPATITVKGDSGAVCVVGGGDDCLTVGATTSFIRSGGVVTQIRREAPDVATPRITTIGYDGERIYPSVVTDASGHSTVTRHHPALGVPVVTIDQNGVTAYQQWDGFGRLRATTDPAMPATTTSYTPLWTATHNRIMSATSAADGSGRIVITDELGRPVESQTLGFGPGQWVARTDSYSPFGFRRVHDGPPGEDVAVTRDRLGRDLVRVTNGVTTTFKHNFFQSQTDDPMGHTSYLVRDVHGRIVESGHRVNGATVGQVTFGYGAFGQLEHAVVAGDHATATTFGYDPLGRTTEIDDPDRGPTTMRYDGFGEVLAVKSAIGALETGYDELGRPVWTQGNDGLTTFEYGTQPGAIGRQIAATSPDGVVTEHEYDALGRPVLLRQTIDGVADEIATSYDLLGRISTVSYPEPATGIPLVTRNEYNGNGYLARILDVSECAVPVDPQCAPDELWRVSERNDAMALARAAYGNGAIELEHDHDFITGALTDVIVDQAQFWRQYGYDDDGLLSSRADIAGPSSGRYEGFTHDELHRLTEWSLGEAGAVGLPGLPGVPAAGTKTTTYGYDELGNLEQVHRNNTLAWDAVYGAQGKPHALASANGDLFTYDDAGRQETGAGRTVEYTQFDLPRQVKVDASGATAVLTYDAFGQRARKTVEKATTTYLAGLYERRVTDAGTTDVYMVYADTGVVAQIARTPTGLVRQFVITDPLGSASLVMEMVAGVPTLTGTRYFEPFGGEIDAAGTPVGPVGALHTRGFTGHDHDLELGLINMRGRIYDPGTRRFLTPDPLVNDPLFGQTYNPYSYVANNPLNLVDPSGFAGESPDAADKGERPTPHRDPVVLGLTVSACADGSFADGPCNARASALSAPAAADGQAAPLTTWLIPVELPPSPLGQVDDKVFDGPNERPADEPDPESSWGKQGLRGRMSMPWTGEDGKDGFIAARIGTAFANKVHGDFDPSSAEVLKIGKHLAVTAAAGMGRKPADAASLVKGDDVTAARARAAVIESAKRVISSLGGRGAGLVVRPTTGGQGVMIYHPATGTVEVVGHGSVGSMTKLSGGDLGAAVKAAFPGQNITGVHLRGCTVGADYASQVSATVNGAPVRAYLDSVVTGVDGVERTHDSLRPADSVVVTGDSVKYQFGEP